MSIRMNLLTPELVLRAFQIKYDYPRNLSIGEIYHEFERRYNVALNLRQSSEVDRSREKILEGISLTADPAGNQAECKRRRSEIASIAAAVGCHPTELELLAEDYLAQLEVRWIQEG